MNDILEDNHTKHILFEDCPDIIKIFCIHVTNSGNELEFIDSLSKLSVVGRQIKWKSVQKYVTHHKLNNQNFEVL